MPGGFFAGWLALPSTAQVREKKLKDDDVGDEWDVE